jgi:glyoxylase-like metal-dependent hydrolase (beta-lactamase superfamily II)
MNQDKRSTEMSRREFLISSGVLCGGLMASNFLNLGCASKISITKTSTAMKLYVIKSGTLYMTASAVVNKDNLTTEQAYADTNIMPLPVYGVLIQHPEGNILFDAGLHLEDRQIEAMKTAFVTDDGNKDFFLNNISKIVDPADVNHIVLSHLHPDHTGFIDRFPDAQIYAGQDALTEYFEKEGVKDDSFIGADVEAWMEAGLKWNLVRGELHEEIKLVDGISMIRFGDGHSYDMITLLVELPETGNIILASDLAHTLSNLGPPTIKPCSVMMVDEEGYVSSHKYLLELAEKKNAQIWVGHDKDQFEGLIKSDEGFYE